MQLADFLGAGQESGGSGGDVTWALLASPTTGGRTIHSSYISSALSNYLPLSGGTMAGTINYNYDNHVALSFRSPNAGYDSKIEYMTYGQEALVFANKNSGTSFMFYSGLSLTDRSDWYNLGTPDLQIKNKCVYINELIANDTAPSYSLRVNGMTSIQHMELGHDNEINGYNNDNLHINYRSSGMVSLCYGGGDVNVGTLSGSYRLNVNGAVGATGYNNTSDIRKKNVIKDTDLRIEQIAKAPSFEYRWKDSKIDTDLHVLPQVVTTAKDEIGTKAMQYGVAALISVITVARKVMTHEEKIALLETRVSALEKENSEQEQLINSLKEELSHYKIA